MDFLLIDDDPGDVCLTQEVFPIQTVAATLHNGARRQGSNVLSRSATPKAIAADVFGDITKHVNEVWLGPGMLPAVKE